MKYVEAPQGGNARSPGDSVGERDQHWADPGDARTRLSRNCSQRLPVGCTLSRQPCSQMHVAWLGRAPNRNEHGVKMTLLFARLMGHILWTELKSGIRPSHFRESVVAQTDLRGRLDLMPLLSSTSVVVRSTSDVLLSWSTQIALFPDSRHVFPAPVETIALGCRAGFRRCGRRLTSFPVRAMPRSQHVTSW